MSFFGRIGNAWNIFKTSFSFIGRDKSLLAVPLIMFFSGALFTVLFFVALFASDVVGGAFYALLLLFMFFMYLWSTFLGAAQAWMVHEVAQGKDTTLGSGIKRAIKNLGDVFAFAFVMLLINLLANWLRQKGTAGRVAGGFLELVTGIAGKLVLPAMIVTERNFVESVKQLGHAIKAIPEIATYEIGVRPLQVLALLVSIGVALVFGFAFGAVVGIVTFALLAVAVILLSILVEQIYYTLLYLTLIEKKKVKGLKLAA